MSPAILLAHTERPAWTSLADLAPRDAARILPFRPMVGPPSANEPRIVLADEDRLLREILAHRLSAASLRVTAVDSAVALLAEARQQAADALVVSLELGGKSFGELVRAVRQFRRGRIITVVGISKMDPRRSAVRALEAGADDVMAVPIAPEELVARLRRLLASAALRTFDSRKSA